MTALVKTLTERVSTGFEELNPVEKDVLETLGNMRLEGRYRYCQPRGETFGYWDAGRSSVATGALQWVLSQPVAKAVLLQPPAVPIRRVIQRVARLCGREEKRVLAAIYSLARKGHLGVDGMGLGCWWRS